MCRSYAVVLSVLLYSSAFSGEYGISASLKGSLTSTTRMMYDIHSSNYDEPDRNIATNWGYGIDVRKNIFWERFYLGVSAEVIHGSTTVNLIYPQFQNLRVRMDEGFEALIGEVSGYYVVPISSETILFYLGGGIGYHTGKREFSIAGYQANNLHSSSNIGIHVLTGADFQVLPNVALRAELKFRDPYFDATTKFENSFVLVQGQRIPLSQQEQVTRINLYGINYAASFVVTL